MRWLVVVSEETGNISVAYRGEFVRPRLSSADLEHRLSTLDMAK